MTNKTWMAVVVGLGFAAAAGCKGKDKQEAPTAGSAAGSATGSAAGSAAPTPTAGTATIAEGEVKPGCFAWSASKQAAACVVGVSGLGVEPELYLAYVGKAGSKTKLELAPAPEAAGVSAMPHVAPAAVKTANEALARDGFAPLAGAPQPVADKPVELNGVAFTLTSEETAKGGDNQPPTTKYTITANCAPNNFVTTNEGEGLELTASVRAAEDGILVIDRHSHIGREGESSDHYEAAVLSKTTCTGFTAE